MANSRKDSKGRKLYDGETERKDGRYMYRYTDKRNGKRHCIYANGLPELREKEKSIALDIAGGIQTSPDAKKLTVNALFERYLATRQVSGTTKVSYLSAWNNRVKTALANTKGLSSKIQSCFRFKFRHQKSPLLIKVARLPYL